MLLLIACAFVAIGAWEVWGQGSREVWNLLGLAFFGVGVLVFACQIVFPARLEIGPAGVRQIVMWRSHRFSWNDIENFRPGSGYLRRSVVFDFTERYRNRPRLRDFNRALAGAEAAFPPAMELDPFKLAELLADAKRRWSGRMDEVAGARTL